MSQPQPDNPAYDGSIIVKTVTARKSKDSQESSEVNRVKRAIILLDKEIDKRLTIDSLDPERDLDMSTQILVNKEVVKELRKITGLLGNFVRNNQ